MVTDSSSARGDVGMTISIASNVPFREVRTGGLGLELDFNWALKTEEAEKLKG